MFHITTIDVFIDVADDGDDDDDDSRTKCLFKRLQPELVQPLYTD